MEAKLIEKLEELGLLFGFSEDAEHQAPIETDTAALLDQLLQDFDGVGESGFEAAWVAVKDDVEGQVADIFAKYMVGG